MLAPREARPPVQRRERDEPGLPHREGERVRARAVLATALLLMLTSPTYTAEVTLLIERKPPRVLDIHEASAEFFVPDEYDFYKTQYELLKSRALAAKVIRELGLNPQNLRGEGKKMLEGVKLYSR